MKPKLKLFSILLFILTGCMTENSAKEFILRRKTQIIKEDTARFSIEIPEGYYTEATIRLNSDNSYTVVFWGDRQSWKWDFKKDFSFTVDIPYKESKGEDVKLDKEIMSLPVILK